MKNEREKEKERELTRLLYRQLGLDYCCSEEEAAGPDNQFHVYRPLDGRRRFRAEEPCYLKVLSVKGKLLFTGQEGILEWCRARYEKEPGAWFMDPPRMRELGDRISEDGFRIEMLHPFFVSFEKGPEDLTACRDRGISIVRFHGAEIEKFRGDARFSNAYSFCETAPDMLGAAAVRGGDVLAMAGASADSPDLWQIGIDVVPKARGEGLGVLLTGLLRNEILDLGHLPYYGAAVSHTISQNIAIRCGFRLAWTELTCARIP